MNYIKNFTTPSLLKLLVVMDIIAYFLILLTNEYTLEMCTFSSVYEKLLS